MAEKLFRAAHERRAGAGGHGFAIDPALATSMGLTPDNFIRLMRDAGFRPGQVRRLPEGAQGPPAPTVWCWRPPRNDRPPDSQAPPRYTWREYFERNATVSKEEEETTLDQEEDKAKDN